MKKLLVLAMLVMTSIVAMGQTEVTKFLGIPVDGFKPQMKQKLIAKGFQQSKDGDCLTGEFNGQEVNVFIATNNNKVWRIMVADAIPSNESDIKIRFNNLCAQFEKNKRYFPSNLGLEKYTIGDDVDISYEMSVNNKRFQASYFQDIDRNDTAYAQKEILSALSEKYTQEQLANPTEKEKVEIEELESEICFYLRAKKTVWFMINENYGKYFITMFYDNEFNHSNGEDL